MSTKEKSNHVQVEIGDIGKNVIERWRERASEGDKKITTTVRERERMIKENN